jgi:hypothetical protein
VPENEEGASTGAQTYSGKDFRPAQGAFTGLSFSEHHYFLDLRRGDSVDVVGAASTTTGFIQVKGGSAFAFFFDRPDPLTGLPDGIPAVDELTGLSVSAGANVTVIGNIDGDVVANRDGVAGPLMADSLISTKQTISFLSADLVGTNSGRDGKIIAGGNLANVDINKAKTIQSGTPVYDQPDRLQYNFGGSKAGPGIGVGTLQEFKPGIRAAGGDLTNITVTAADYMLAGPGGDGGRGGNINGLLVVAEADASGLTIRAGDGGEAARGGSGGSVSNVVIQGTPGAVPNAPLRIEAGDGGDASATGAGGAGGKLSKVWVGYGYTEASPKTPVESSTPANSNIVLSGGRGGFGATAGAGGAISGIAIFASTPEQTGERYEIQVLGGDGGSLPDAGAKKAGAGGVVSNIKIKNYDTSADPSDVLIAGGDASKTLSGGLAAGTGASGGGVSNPAPRANEEWLIGASFRVEGGQGSDSSSRGGGGGGVNGLYFQAFSSLVLRDLEVVAGAGGQSSTGTGGAGGSISRVYAEKSDLNGDALTFLAGAGGESLGGRGGAGGSISLVDVPDIDSRDIPESALMIVQSGSGGTGFRGGGAGGNLNNITLFSTSAALEIRAGEGGDSSSGATTGVGGNGGSITGLAFVTSRGGSAQTVSVAAGNGGDGNNSSGRGGRGGGISFVNVQAAGAIDLDSGDGGNGRTGGSGGSISGASTSAAGVVLASRFAGVDAQAGDGRGAGPTGGAGGSVRNIVVAAEMDINVRAGDGGFGAAGGSLSRVNFGGDSKVASSPDGNVTLRAGDGGNAFTISGRGGIGGSMSQISGFTSDNARNLSGNPSDWNHLIVAAGDGGDGARGAAGGSVNGLNLLDGLAPFLVSAGDGGNGTSSGGAGGSLLNVSSAVRGIALALAAGDGGDALNARKGAAGGSVDRVNVFGDIGIRTGASYGFADDPAQLGTRMGGIFAGKGGEGSSGVMAVAGKVTNITAQAISAIVAGRESSPYLVSLVDRIYLNGNNELKRFGDTLPGIAQAARFFAGTGGGGAATGANVMGSGATLAVSGDYDGALNFDLQTVGGSNFSGVAVLYFDTDAAASGLLSTSSLTPRNEYDPDFTLKASVAGLTYNAIPPEQPVPAPRPLATYRSILDFDATFAPEYALALDAGRWGLYALTSPNGANLTTPLLLQSGVVVASGNSYGVSLTYADFGLSSKVTSDINLVATYLAGLDQIPQTPVAQQVGAYRTNQAIGFSVSGDDPGSASALNPPTPQTRVSSSALFTQQLANFVGGKAGSPTAVGAVNFAYANGSFSPSAQLASSWDYGANGTQPLDGLIAAAKMTDLRNFEPLAFLTNASAGVAELWLPTLPSA